MSTNSNIKVIKKAEAVARPKKKVKPESPREAAREMVSTVTGWVSELKDRKREETRAALSSLFGGNTQPSES